MSTKIHRVRYYNPKPKSINALCLNPGSKALAVSREDATIEIWDLNHAPLMVKFIPGVENGSVEALCWVRDRLLSTGLGGSLIEWDLDKLTPRKTVLLTGYAAWCLDVNPAGTLVAVGTEQGYINMFSTEKNDIIYKKLFDKQEGRIICCKFNHAGNILVSGSVNTIRVWDVATGQAVTRMSTKRRGKENIVWALAVLSDNTIISGETGGRLSFWDGTSGDQIETFMTHKADILSIAVSDNEEHLFCSGVDPVIVNFAKLPAKTSNKSGCQWAKHLQRHIHEHDIRCLTLNGDTLVSAGIDGYLTFSGYPPKWVMRMPPLLPEPRSVVCVKKKLLLLRYSDHLEVWKLGSYALNDKGKPILNNVDSKQICSYSNDSERQSLECDSSLAIESRAKLEMRHQNVDLKLEESPSKLVSVNTKGGKPLRCCSLSPDGQVIVYSTDSHIRMLKLETDDDCPQNSSISLSKISLTGLHATYCDHMAFTHDSRNLLLHSAGTIYVMQVDPNAHASTILQAIPTAKYLKCPTLLHLAVSDVTASGATYLVAADTGGSIAVWSKKSSFKFEHYSTLPKYYNLPSALAVDAQREQIIVAYVDQKIVDYDLRNKKLTDSLGAQLPPEWFSRKSAITGVSFHPTKPDCYVFTDNTSIWILETQNKNQKESYRPSFKRRPHKSDDANATLRIVPIKYLAGFHWLGDAEAVMVETLPEHIVAQLPDVLARKRPPHL